MTAQKPIAKRVKGGGAFEKPKYQNVIMYVYQPMEVGGYG
jgi:hypothetical protein